MRPELRNLLLVVAFGAVASAQTMTEFSAAAAGGTVGGAAGKKVSEGVTSIFEKVNKQTATAASGSDAVKAKKAPAVQAVPKTEAGPALIEAGPGKPDSPSGKKAASAAAPKSVSAKTKAKATAQTKPGDPATVPASAWDDVPPPPPLQKSHVAMVAAKPVARSTVIQHEKVAPEPPPPSSPPPMTLQDLQKITAGMSRTEVLKLGEPADRITMFEDGGLLEIFSYQTHDPVHGDRLMGLVRMVDGTVSDVQLRN